MRVLLLLFQFGFLLFLFLLWLLWPKLPELCWIVAVKVDTLVLFLTLGEMLSQICVLISPFISNEDKNRLRDARGLCDRIYIINFPQNMSNSKFSEMLPVISSSSKNSRNNHQYHHHYHNQYLNLFLSTHTSSGLIWSPAPDLHWHDTFLITLPLFRFISLWK